MTGEQRTESFKVPRGELLSGRRPYHLEEADFLRLTKIVSFLPIWAHTLLAGTGIYLLNLAARLLDEYLRTGIVYVDSFDRIFLVLLLVVTGLLQSINAFWPTERKRAQQRIEKHFKGDKRRLLMVEPNDD